MKNTMTNNVKNIDFSSRTPYDGSCVSDDEVVVPMVYTDELKILLFEKGYRNIQVDTHHLPNGKKYKACYTKIKKADYPEYKKTFDREVHSYLNCETEQVSKFDRDVLEDTEKPVLSLDIIYDSINSKDESGFDPTGTRKYDNTINTLYLLEDLLESLQDDTSRQILTMLYEGYTKEYIWKNTLLNSKGHTQAYEDIKKVQLFAKKNF